MLKIERRTHKINSSVALRDACYVRVSSRLPDVLGLPGLLVEDGPWGLGLGAGGSGLSRGSAALGMCSLRGVAAGWLRSRAAGVHEASSGNCFPFSPAAECPF